MESQLILEVKLQMYLSHPNILKLYHFFSDSSHIYLIMEYMEEGSLFDSMQKKTSIFTEKETAEILIDVASAVTYLHDIDIVHRDIKPENIVISNVSSGLCRECANCVILDGPLSVQVEDPPTVEPSTTQPQRSLKESIMTPKWTCGAWEF